MSRASRACTEAIDKRRPDQARPGQARPGFVPIIAQPRTMRLWVLHNMAARASQTMHLRGGSAPGQVNKQVSLPRVVRNISRKSYCTVPAGGCRPIAAALRRQHDQRAHGSTRTSELAGPGSQASYMPLETGRPRRAKPVDFVVKPVAFATQDTADRWVFRASALATISPR